MKITDNEWKKHVKPLVYHVDQNNVIVPHYTYYDFLEYLEKELEIYNETNKQGVLFL